MEADNPLNFRPVDEAGRKSQRAQNPDLQNQNSLWEGHGKHPVCRLSPHEQPQYAAGQSRDCSKLLTIERRLADDVIDVQKTACDQTLPRAGPMAAFDAGVTRTCYNGPIIVSGLRCTSFRTTLNNELWTSRWPL
jgi:hypothetical protein